MNGQGQFGLALVLSGLLLLGVGGLWLLGTKLGFTLGHLPGDITISSGRSRFYIPLTTCLLISGALSALAWLIRRFLS